MSLVDRYGNRRIITNQSNLYKSMLDKRFVNKIEHYNTPILRYPTDEEIGELDFEEVVWSVGSSYTKLAYDYYGSPQLWWVIAWFNKKPMDTEVKLGDLIMIPLPIEKILTFYDY